MIFFLLQRHVCFLCMLNFTIFKNKVKGQIERIRNFGSVKNLDDLIFHRHIFHQASDK